MSGNDASKQAGTNDERTVVSVVVQTHWDREWYLPHQSFIARLLHVMEKIATQLESGQLATFLFDGQTAAMEDLLGNCEPQLAARVRRLVQEQRIVLGPWYVMADQFLCSGESLLRNLEIGIADATAMGNCQLVGYLPDTFGHIAQMPQLLRNFGIGGAVMWRGVDTPHSEFDWRGPDGSVAGTVFLTQGYYQHPFNVAKWEDALATYLGQIAPRTQAGRLLLTQGGDHLVSHDGLAERIAGFNAAQARYMLVQDTLAGYVTAALAGSDGKRVVIDGELRQNAQTFVLPDVLSTRRYLKRLNQEAEDRLAGVIEPLYAQLATQEPHPAAYLEQCWRTVLQQQAHDSICGCSADEVHDEMRNRYVLLNQRFDALVERACASAGMIALAASNKHGLDPFEDDTKFTLLNPQPYHVDGWQEVEIFLKGERRTALSLTGPVGESLEHTLLDATPHKTLRSPLDDFPDMLAGHLYKVALRVALPGMGALACCVQPAAGAAVGPVSASAIENDAIRIDFNAGVLTWTDRQSGEVRANPLALFSELDAGDSYNFSPPPQQHHTLVRHFTNMVVGCLPGLQEMTLDVAMRVPAGLDGERQGASSDKVTCHGTLRLRLWQGRASLDCQLDWHNHARDQRTRLLMPVPADLASTWSDSAFSWQERPVVHAAYPAEPSRREMPVCVNPTYSAIGAGPLGFAHRAMQEYEVLLHEGQHYLGVTLVRSVGWMSRRDLVTRGVGAGPDIPTPGAQCLGSERFDFAIGSIAQGDARQTLALARQLRHPVQLLRGHSTAWKAPIEIGDSGLQTSALRRVGSEVELRVWNPCSTTLHMTAGDGWQRMLADGSAEAGGINIAPHAIATFRRPA